jgi:Tol biopolymer transport system component
MKKLYLYITPLVLFAGILSAQKNNYSPSKDTLRFEGEKHLRNIKQLTFGGNNAEAYWSFDNKQLIFQSDWAEINPQGCDQIFKINVSGKPVSEGRQYQMVSTGKGRTTCSYFLKDGRIIYASTHKADEKCPETKMFEEGKYVWPIYHTYDIYIANADGSSPKLLIGGEGYDAEATVSPDGRYIVFTSTRSGDLDLWRYDLKTGKYLQLTNKIGYDGGAFFSPDSKKIVWRASRPKGKEAEDYISLLKKGYIEPKELNIYIADIDGKNVHQVTNLPGANWAPFFHPDGKKVLFCSNYRSLDKGGRIFDIFMINIDGTGLEQITNSGNFSAFPMFSYDGKKIAFSSNRRGDRKQSHETNVFVADWVENPVNQDKNFKEIKK